MNITYGSVCSGIEAASVAWEKLGFTPKWFSEIEAFPSAVLAHHWPQVVNLGDMTKIADRILAGEIDAPDVLVGGTPCQAFSVAGARKGLADERGQLTISYGELADAIDDTRIAAGKQPSIIVWENVPGVLSSKDNAFGAFLGLLSGEECELVPPGGKWTNAGYVSGPKRAIAWRVLDAQYFGVAQRRRRVFVVASARTDFDPSKVLFEREGVRRDTPPSREAGSVVVALTANGVGTCGEDDNQGQAGHLIAMAHGQGGAEIRDDGLCPTLTCNHEAPIGVYSVHGTQDPDTNTELAHTLGRNQGQENAVLTEYNSIKDHDRRVIFAANNWDELVRENPPCVTGDITHTLKGEGFDASEDGTGRGQPIVPVAFSSKDYGGDATENMSPTLRACGHADSHANAGAPPAVAYPILEVGKRTGTSTTDPRAGLGIGSDGDPMFTLQAGAQHGVAAFAENSRQEVRLEGGDGQITGALSSGGGKVGKGYPAAMVGMAVRRLTPVECERLQDFPDNHTLIPVAKRNKLIEDELGYLRHHFPDMPEDEMHRLAADGPRYKAIGNSMAIPCMEWIGRRILLQLRPVQ